MSSTCAEDDMVAPERVLSSLHLPHMPETSSLSPPTVRLLVCADVSLQSSSNLCEYILQQRKFSPNSIDMILVAGPFVEETLNGPVIVEPSSSLDATTVPNYCLPFLESKESNAARHGMITACLSQLENIVCRVVYLLGSTDPRGTSLRHTPNSRSIQRQWLPIAPSLGCAGLMYLDQLDTVVEELEEQDTTTSDAGSDSSSDDDSTRERSKRLLQLLRKLPDRTLGYRPTLEKILQLANNRTNTTTTTSRRHEHVHPVDQQSPQTIFVTQYVQRSTANAVVEADTNDDTYYHRQSEWLDSHSDNVCMEIATRGVDDDNEEARWITPRLLYPGSLRKRGEFTLIDMSLIEPKEDGQQEQQHKTYSWNVRDSSFHVLNSFP